MLGSGNELERKGQICEGGESHNNNKRRRYIDLPPDQTEHPNAGWLVGWIGMWYGIRLVGWRQG
jgi:hypothetical protein